MEPTVTIGGAANTTILTLGEALFRWIPGVIASLIGTGPAETNMDWTGGATLSEPVTTGQLVQYVQSAAGSDTAAQLFSLWTNVVILSLSLSFLLAGVIIYCLLRIRQIRMAEHRRFNAASHPVASHDVSRLQQRWQRILSQVDSGNDQGWRLAILEADILLNELLDTLGYKGETMADKMRAVGRGDFKTIDMAWEAHRARNRVAHEGSAHLLNEREVRRIIGLYERVFQEFDFLT